nr:retrovirus-related Pol polyprotein from transposon TNT 1-94 [Tanacetum cinerariifolium]
MNTKFANQSTERKPSLQSLRNTFVVNKTNDLSNPVTSNSISTTKESKVIENDKVIAPGSFRINPFKNSIEEKFVPNKPIKASVRINPITIAQPHVITKKVANFNSNGFSSTGVDITTNIKNKEVEVEEHPRNLLLSKNKKHMSSECNNIKLAIRNDKSEIVYVMCEQCLISANHDVCVLNYVNGMNSRGKKQKENVSNIAKETKHMPQVKKPKKGGQKGRTKSIALKAKKESSDDETSTSKSDDEEYAMAVRNFKRFFRRKGKFVRQPREEKKSPRQRDEKKGKGDQKCFRCGDPNYLIGDCPKPSRNKDQNAFIGGIGFDSGKASTSRTKTMIFVGSSVEKAMDGSTIKVHGSTLPGSVSRTYGEKGTEHVFSPPMSSRSDFVITRKKLIHNSNDESKKPSLKPSLKSGIVLNKHTMKVEESLNMTFDESPPPTKLSPLVDDDVGEEEAIKRNTTVVNNNNEEDDSIEVNEIVNIKESRNHPLDQVIGNLNQRTLRSQAQNH